jgi:hypothetical protein
MQKMIIAATALLVVQIGLSLVLNVGNKELEAGAPDSLFLEFSPEEVHSLEITDSEGKSVVMEKAPAGWIVPGHFSAPADADKIKELVEKLAGMKQGFVVATTSEAAGRFRVDPESFENHVVLRGAEKTLADFYVGTSPAFRQVHARRGESDNIVTVPLSGFELESGADKWLDTSLATIPEEDLVGLAFEKFQLKKTGDGWQLEGLKEDEKINREKVEELVAKARTLTVQDVLDPAEVSGLVDQPDFQFSAAVKGGREVKYLFAKAEGDFYVLKLSDRDLYLKVHTLPVESLRKGSREELVLQPTVVEKNDEPEEQQ